ncbi:MAG: response regulator [Flavobacteriales bacterium]
MKIKIYIIDDHKILIDTFKQYFEAIADFDVVGYALNGCEAIEMLNPNDGNIKPDIVLQDIDLPDMNGIDCTKALLKLNPDLKIIGVSTYTETAIVKKLMNSGAKGYISKSNDIENLENAIRKVYNNEEYLGSTIANNLLQEMMNAPAPKRKSLIPSITERENDVLLLIYQERNTDEIAKELFISVNTVQTHRKNLILKFDVRNSVGLVRKAIEFGIIKI